MAGPSNGSVTLRNVLHRPAPSIAAASTSCGRHALERREVDDRVEAQPAPHRHDHQRRQGLRRRGEEPERPQPHLAQRVVREPEVLVEQPQEHDPGGDRRGDHGDEHRQPVEADQPDLPVEGGGHEQRERDRDRHEHHRVDQRVERRLARQRVLRDRPVVVQPDERSHRTQQRRLLHRQHQAPHDREQAEEQDQRHRRQDERPPRHVVGGRGTGGTGPRPDPRPPWRRRRRSSLGRDRQDAVHRLGGLVQRLSAGPSRPAARRRSPGPWPGRSGRSWRARAAPSSRWRGSRRTRRCRGTSCRSPR